MLKLSSHPLLYFVIIFIAIEADLDSDRSALLALRSSLGGRSLLWNVSEPTPCKWAGVTCSPGRSRVVVLRLPGMGLSGTIPPKTISNLTSLTTLSLRYNSLVAPLPSDFAVITNLRNLYLQHNLFSGPIPDCIFSMTNLVRLNLGDNHFSGPIPSSFNNLTRLGTLYLQGNILSGSIPDLNLPSLDQFNVSNNNLSGPIPGKLSGKQESAFSGNSLCGRPLKLCDGEGQGGNSDKLSAGAIAGIVAGCVIVVLIILLILFFLCRKRGGNEEVGRAVGAAGAAGDAGGAGAGTQQSESGFEIPAAESGGRDSGARAVAGSKDKAKEKEPVPVEVGKMGLVFVSKKGSLSYELDDLLRASAEVLGKGTFGTTYKAVLEMGATVAVKRLKDVYVAEEEFREKMEEIGSVDHENLMPLRAYFYTRDEKLLVYDYLPMGSLSALLHGNKGSGRTPLNWETRAAIALGAARGITYLHAQGSSVSHGNIKSSNVLLTKNYEARVSDFGLAQIVAPGSSPTHIAGYRAPEVTDPSRVSQKADVYSFGVLLLELLTGKAPTHALMNEEGVDLPRWVQSVVREEWTAEVFDLELLRYQNVEEDMVQLLQLAIDCTAQYPDQRPSMAEVTMRIDELCNSTLQDTQGDIISYDSDTTPP